MAWWHHGDGYICHSNSMAEDSIPAETGQQSTPITEQVTLPSEAHCSTQEHSMYHATPQCSHQDMHNWWQSPLCRHQQWRWMVYFIINKTPGEIPLCFCMTPAAYGSPKILQKKPEFQWCQRCQANLTVGPPSRYVPKILASDLLRLRSNRTTKMSAKHLLEVLQLSIISSKLLQSSMKAI